MDTKRTILSEREYNLIEEIIAQFSVIVTFEQIFSILKKRMSRQAARNLINKLVKNGWLVRIKKGTYAISSLESRGLLTLSTFKTAQILNENSYISFEAALQHHGMFDQMLKKIASVSLKRQATKDVQETTYQFVKTKKDLFFGWEEERVDNFLVKVATSEKAALDILTYRRNAYSIDLVFEKLSEYKKKFNFDRLNKFCSRHSLTVQRILGFLLDKLSIDSTYLYNLTKKSKSTSFMTKDSKQFNAKWRFYYDKHFEEKE